MQTKKMVIIKLDGSISEPSTAAPQMKQKAHEASSQSMRNKKEEKYPAALLDSRGENVFNNYPLYQIETEFFLHCLI